MGQLTLSSHRDIHITIWRLAACQVKPQQSTTKSHYLHFRLYNFPALLSCSPATHRTYCVGKHKDGNAGDAAIGVIHSTPSFHRKFILISLGSAFELSFSGRQKFRLSIYQILGYGLLAPPAPSGHAHHGNLSKLPKNSNIFTLIIWCYHCQKVFSPLHFFWQDLECPKICLRNFTCHSNSCHSNFLFGLSHSPKSTFLILLNFNTFCWDKALHNILSQDF